MKNPTRAGKKKYSNPEIRSKVVRFMTNTQGTAATENPALPAAGYSPNREAPRRSSGS